MHHETNQDTTTRKDSSVIFVKFYVYFETFRNSKKKIYGEGLSAPRPTPKLEDHPLSAVRDCLFNIFAATLRKD